jgi:hypothetical protein
MAATRKADKHEVKATQHASGEARSLAETMPRLILEARRIAATVIHGLPAAGPGRARISANRRFLRASRRAGSTGANRPRRASLCASRAEAVHTAGLWPDRSPSMVFKSHLALEPARSLPGRRLRWPRCWCRPASGSACRV